MKPLPTSIARSTELVWWFFANNSVIIASATMKLDQNLVRLTPADRDTLMCHTPFSVTRSVRP